ncbi:hypothetical protein CXP47_20415 [Pseudomonas chlororaphis]|nr:hypothetical protein CXP47_20415 [Pseudomonas chlororaphis]
MPADRRLRQRLHEASLRPCSRCRAREAAIRPAGPCLTILRWATERRGRAGYSQPAAAATGRSPLRVAGDADDAPQGGP